MTRTSYDADQFVLLFSADWFRPYWHLLGFRPREGQAAAFQQAMRDAARELMGLDAEYWMIRFDDERALHTRRRWLDALDAHAGADTRFELLKRWDHGSVERKALRGWLAYEFYDEWQEVEGAALDATDWDRWLVSLTLDLPEMLRTFARAAVFG